MDPLFAPIADIGLEQYAELCALMADTNNDEAREVAVAEEHGVSGVRWLEAKRGWTDRMMDDARKTGKLAQAFMPVYQAKQAELRGGAEPCDLETYTRIAAELAFLKDEQGVQIAQEVTLARHGLNVTKWGEISGYWVPKVNTPTDPSATRFRELMQQESDRIFGIDRGAPKAAPTASPAASAAPRPAPQVPAVAEEPTDFVSMILQWLRKLLGL
ncbi:MAG TPA: hypothetical protein PKA64_11400 [Myxococcota bacterium]|nr:hypothetical protein [Myxococcota bacterium]